MRKKWIVMLACSLYAIQVAVVVMFYTLGQNPELSITGEEIKPIRILFFASLACSLVFIVANLIAAAKTYTKLCTLDPSARPSDSKVFGKIMVAKLVLVPFYVINFILWVIVAIGSLNPFLFLIGWVATVVMSTFAYITMLSTSCYNIAKLVAMRKTKQIALSECLIHILVQLFFVADVIDTIVLLTKER